MSRRDMCEMPNGGRGSVVAVRRLGTRHKHYVVQPHERPPGTVEVCQVFTGDTFTWEWPTDACY